MPGKRANLFLILFFIFFSIESVKAQDWALSNIKQLQRVDLRRLGYPEINEIPENSTAITSLLTARTGKIYGGTTGDEAYLFVFDPASNKVQHLGKLPGQKTIHHSLVEDKDGYIYAGTGGVNPFEKLEFSSEGVGENPVNRFHNTSIWKDILAQYAAAPTGQLYRYDPLQSERPIPVQGVFSADHEVKFVGMESSVVNLGSPVPKNMIYAMTIDPAGTKIYGLTYPDGYFFVFDIGKGIFENKGQIDSNIRFHGPERHWRSLPRALICDKAGNVYTSGPEGDFVYYDPLSDSIKSTGQKVPGESYPIHRTDTYAVVEYLARGSDGVIFGGTSDGFLFSYSPEEKKLSNLGKVRAARRLRALTAGNNGLLFLVAGERPDSSPSPCQFYSYDPSTGAYTTLGLLVVDRSPHYYWRGYQFDSITTGIDGTIYLGESERRSHLFLYIP